MQGSPFFFGHLTSEVALRLMRSLAEPSGFPILPRAKAAGLCKTIFTLYA